MNVTIQYTAQLRRQAGVPSDQLELTDGATIDDAAVALAEQRQTIADSICHQGKLAADLQPFINGQQVKGETVLNDGNEVLLLSPIAGG